MRVLGAGMGRTGTLSLKAGLERLGFGPCFHMLDLIADTSRVPGWAAAAAGTADWDDVLAGYHSAVDWPPSHFWRELAAAYPAAKVVLTVRDSGDWYDSYSALFHRMRGDPGRRRVSELGNLIKNLLINDTFEDRLGDREHCVSVFERHNAEVAAELAGDRLLVFDVRQGWGPLCAFLGVPEPEGEPFPRLNERGTVFDNIRTAMRPSAR